MSFGYASVATYYTPLIQQEVARVLVSQGLLIADFQNAACIYGVLCPTRLVNQYRRFRRWDRRKPNYYFGVRGVVEYFSSFGLRLMKTQFTNCFPPFKSLLEPEYLIFLDRMIHRLRVERLFGRVFIAVFRKE